MFLFYYFSRNFNNDCLTSYTGNTELGYINQPAQLLSAALCALPTLPSFLLTPTLTGSANTKFRANLKHLIFFNNKYMGVLLLFWNNFNYNANCVTFRTLFLSLLTVCNAWLYGGSVFFNNLTPARQRTNIDIEIKGSSPSQTRLSIIYFRKVLYLKTFFFFYNTQPFIKLYLAYPDFAFKSALFASSHQLISLRFMTAVRPDLQELSKSPLYNLGKIITEIDILWEEGVELNTVKIILNIPTYGLLSVVSFW